MDEADKTWLDNANHQCHVEEQIAQETPSADTDEVFIRVSISEDAFELVMGLFEILTGPKLQQELPDFSFFKPFFLVPLGPDTFASQVVPAWIRPLSVLSSIALTIHPHWQQRRSLRGGHKIFPSLNSEENDYINAAYSVLKPIRFVPWAAPPTEGGGVPRRGRPSATILTPQHKAAPTHRATRTPKDEDLRFLARDIFRALGKAHHSTTDDEPPHANQRAQALAALPLNELSTPSVSIVISAPPSSSVAWPSQGVPLLLPTGSSLTVRAPGPTCVDRPPLPGPRSFYVLVPPAPTYVKAAALKRALRLYTRPPVKVGASGFKEPG
ncbi:hypothetical protein B0H11DRAFT_2286157 [Mycena galericulata]|nr:hypothetical protein B0H11DRAFT_2286157 [Mycena galericulata]